MNENSKTALLEVTHEELRHLINDTIAYIWRMEDKGLDHRHSYGVRVKLKEKMEAFEREHFQQMDCADGG